ADETARGPAANFPEAVGDQRVRDRLQAAEKATEEAAEAVREAQLAALLATAAGQADADRLLAGASEAKAEADRLVTFIRQDARDRLVAEARQTRDEVTGGAAERVVSAHDAVQAAHHTLRTAERALDARLSELAEQRTKAETAADTLHRLHGEAGRLTRWHQLPDDPDSGAEGAGRTRAGVPEPRVTAGEPAGRTGTAPLETVTEESPVYTPATALADGSPALTSPEGTTHPLRDVPEDGTSFYHAFIAAHGRITDDADTLRTRFAEALAALPDDAPLLAYLAPDEKDTFTAAEVEAAGLDLGTGTPERREFDDFGVIPHSAGDQPTPERRHHPLTPAQRRGLAAAQLRRPAAHADKQTWDNAAADLLPALAARMHGTVVRVVREDGSFLDYPPDSEPLTDDTTPGVVLHLADERFRAVLPEEVEAGPAAPAADTPAEPPADDALPAHAHRPWTWEGLTDGESEGEPKYDAASDPARLTDPDGYAYRLAVPPGDGNRFYTALAMALNDAGMPSPNGGGEFQPLDLSSSAYLPLPGTARLDPRATFRLQELAGARITLTDDQRRAFERGGGRLPEPPLSLTRRQEEALIRAQLFAARRWNRPTALLAAELVARNTDIHLTLVHENGTIDTFGVALGEDAGNAVTLYERGDEYLAALPEGDRNPRPPRDHRTTKPPEPPRRPTLPEIVVLPPDGPEGAKDEPKAPPAGDGLGFRNEFPPVRDIAAELAEPARSTEPAAPAEDPASGSDPYDDRDPHDRDPHDRDSRDSDPYAAAIAEFDALSRLHGLYDAYAAHGPGTAREVLRRLDTLRAKVPELADGPLDLDALARHVLDPDGFGPVTAGERAELLRVALDAADNTHSLAALAGLHLASQGVLGVWDHGGDADTYAARVLHRYVENSGPEHRGELYRLVNRARDTGRDIGSTAELGAFHLEREGVLDSETLLRDTGGRAFGRYLDGHGRGGLDFDPSRVTLIRYRSDDAIDHDASLSVPAPWHRPGGPAPWVLWANDALGNDLLTGVVPPEDVAALLSHDPQVRALAPDAEIVWLLPSADPEEGERDNVDALLLATSLATGHLARASYGEGGFHQDQDTGRVTLALGRDAAGRPQTADDWVSIAPVTRPAPAPVTAPDPDTVPRVLSRADLTGLVDGMVAGLPSGGASERRCVELLGALRDKLYGEDGVRAGGVVDESVLDRSPRTRLVRGPGWGRVGSWSAVGDALRDVRRAGPGSVALVLARRPGSVSLVRGLWPEDGLGHAFAAYHTADDGVVWVDASERERRRVSKRPPKAGLLFDAQAVVIGPSGRVAVDALRLFTESSSVARAVLDGAVRDEYGALGSETEHHYPLDIAVTPDLLRRLGIPVPEPGDEPDLMKVVLAQGPGIKVVVDKAPLGIESVIVHIPKVVVDPAAVVRGERRQSLEEARARRRAVSDRLAGVGVTGQGGWRMPLAELLGDLPGWEITEVGQATTVHPLAESHQGRSSTRFSPGTTTVGLRTLWDHSLDRMWPREMIHLAMAGRGFGRRAALEFVGRLGYRDAAVADVLPFLAAVPDVDEVWGYAWEAFVHVAARPLNDVFPQLVKDWLPVASRHAHDSGRRTLRPGTRDFLDNGHDRLSAIAQDLLKSEMARRLQAARPGEAVPEGFFDTRDAESGDVPSAREHLTAALTGLTSQGRRIGSYEAVGMEEFPALDTDGGRLAVPLMVKELRTYGFGGGHMTEEQTERAETELAELGGVAYERAAAARVPLSHEVLGASVERILGDPVVRGAAPFLSVLGPGIPQVEGPNRRLLSAGDGMNVAVALGRYALGQLRPPGDVPIYQRLAEAAEQVSGLLESGTVPAGARARVEAALRGAREALRVLREEPPPAEIEWPAEIEALDGSRIPVDRVQSVSYRNASDARVAVSLRRDGAPTPWQHRQLESYGLLPEVDHFTEVRWDPDEGNLHRASAVVAEGPRQRAPFGRVFLVGLDGDGTAARLPTGGWPTVAVGYERVVDYLFAHVPELTAASWDTAVLVVGADVAGPYAHGRDPLEWPVAGQVLANGAGLDRPVWTSGLGREVGFATRLEPDGHGGAKRVTWLRLEEGDWLAGFRGEPSSARLAAVAERVTGDRGRAGDVLRWWRAVRLVYGPLLEDDQAAFEAVLRGFDALDQWRAVREDASPLTWTGLRDVVDQYRELMNAYRANSGQDPVEWWQALLFTLVSAAGEAGMELELHGFDLAPRHAPVRAWEQAPEPAVAGPADMADEPPAPAPVRPALPSPSGTGAAGGLAQLAAARPLAVDATDSADLVFVLAWDRHARAWSALVAASAQFTAASASAPAERDRQVRNARDRWRRAREKVEDAESRLWALGVPLGTLAEARAAAVGEIAEAPDVPRSGNHRRWVAKWLTEEDVESVAARLAASVGDSLAAADLAASNELAGDQRIQIAMALRGDNRVPVDVLSRLELARVLMVRSGPWTDGLNELAAAVSRSLWASAYEAFAGAAPDGAVEADVARAWDAAVFLVLPPEPHAVLADSRYAAEEYRDSVRQVAEHLLEQGPDSDAAIRSAGALADDHWAGSGRRRWDAPAPDGAGPGGSPSRVFAAPVAPQAPASFGSPRPVSPAPSAQRPPAPLASPAVATAPGLPPLSVVEFAPGGSRPSESGRAAVWELVLKAASAGLRNWRVDVAPPQIDITAYGAGEADGGEGRVRAVRSLAAGYLDQALDRLQGPPVAGVQRLTAGDFAFGLAWGDGAGRPSDEAVALAGVPRAELERQVTVAFTLAPDAAALERLAALHARDRKLRGTAFDVDVLARRVLHLPKDASVEQAVRAELFGLVRDAERAGRAGSLVALGAFHLDELGAAGPDGSSYFTVPGSGGARRIPGVNWLGPEVMGAMDALELDTDWGDVLAPQWDGSLAVSGPRRATPWPKGETPVVAGGDMRDGRVVVRLPDRSTRDADVEEFVELMAVSVARAGRSGTSIVLAIPFLGQYRLLLQELTERTGLEVWAHSGEVRVSARPDGKSRIGTVSGRPGVPVGTWFPLRPGEGPVLDESVPGWYGDVLLWPVVSEATGEPFAYASFEPGQYAVEEETERRGGRMRTSVHFYRPTETLGPEFELPRPGPEADPFPDTDAFRFDAHGGRGSMKVAVWSGNRVASRSLTEDETVAWVKWLVAHLPRDRWLDLAACWLGTPKDSTRPPGPVRRGYFALGGFVADPLRELSVADRVADETEFWVRASTGPLRTGTLRGSGRSVWGVDADARGRTRGFMLARPRPKGAALDRLAVAARLHSGPDPVPAEARVRTLVAVRALRLMFGLHVDGADDSVELLRGVLAVEEMWLADPGFRRAGPLTLDLLRRVVAAHPAAVSGTVDQDVVRRVLAAASAWWAARPRGPRGERLEQPWDFVELPAVRRGAAWLNGPGATSEAVTALGLSGPGEVGETERSRMLWAYLKTVDLLNGLDEAGVDALARRVHHMDQDFDVDQADRDDLRKVLTWAFVVGRDASDPDEAAAFSLEEVYGAFTGTGMDTVQDGA
ncbi:MAG: lonely Cys domain-containing protein, partial [Streptomyces sp.]|nr:lonely Cys domain-containing protein [Streptomyces sp.]